MNLHELGAAIDLARDAEDQWCSVEKAHALAALVVAYRPRRIVEIGVWRGASLLPQLIALAAVQSGRAIAIDPWSAEASAEGEIQANAEWWGTIDHERAFSDFVGRMQGNGVAHLCDIWRTRSDDCDPPREVDLLHIDGNHTEQAFRDVTRFAPHVVRGGILVLDDLHWDGGGVERGYEHAKTLGFVDRYVLGTGIVMQRQTV